MQWQPQSAAGIVHVCPKQSAPTQSASPQKPLQIYQVLGDRELLDDRQTVGELALTAAQHAAAGQYLHIVCRLKDIESVDVSTSMHRTLSFAFEELSPPIRRTKSALTALLASPDK